MRDAQTAIIETRIQQALTDGATTFTDYLADAVRVLSTLPSQDQHAA